MVKLQFGIICEHTQKSQLVNVDICLTRRISSTNAEFNYLLGIIFMAYLIVYLVLLKKN